MPWLTSRERTRELLADLLSFPSPQPDIAQVQRFVRDCVQAKLFADNFDKIVTDDVGNLLATVRGRGDAKPLLLCFYGATFPQEYMADAYSAKVIDGAPYGLEGDCMVGRGASEQKGPLAAVLEAINSFAHHHPCLDRDVTLAVTVAGEMGNHEVVDHMVQEHCLSPGIVLLSGATNHRISLGNRGRVDIHVEIKGVSCHSSRPHLGRNAIEGLRLFLNHLQVLEFDRIDAQLGEITLTPTYIETWPKAMHTVPSLCRIILDRRLLPGEEPEDAVRQIVEHIDRLEDFFVDISAGRFNYPGKVREDCELVVRAKEAVQSVVGIARTFYQRNTLDAGYFIRKGIDTIHLGPGDSRFAHSDFELISLQQVESAAEYYNRLLWLIAGETPPA